MEDINKHNDLGKALDAFKLAAEQIIGSFYESLKERKPPNPIYHYTNDIGLMGILQTGKLRLSDIFSLNDPSELRHGLSMAVDLLNSKASNGSTVTKTFAENFANFCQDAPPDSAHYFVCSFSSENNDLGQWRAYADNGRGYALEFDEEALIDIFKNEVGVPGRAISTFPVTYDDKKLEGIYRKLIDFIYPLIDRFGINDYGGILNDYLGNLAVELSVKTLEAALHFKHEAYENESKYRFLQIFRGDMKAPNEKWRSRSYEFS